MNAFQPLNSEQIAALTHQTFDLEHPGTLLKDFGALLEFIETHGDIDVSPKNHLFAMKFLPKLNQLITQPLDVMTKRPVQKTFPYLHGLYLLLRISGLATINTKSKKSTLVLNPKILASWQSLNDTERYFALFTAWHDRANNEILGEKVRYFGDFYHILGFFNKLVKNSTFNIKDQNDVYFLRYEPGLHQLALMDLFGFVKIELGARIALEEWTISQIKLTEWGRVFLGYFEQNQYFIFSTDFNKESPFENRFETVMKPYLPNWQNDLESLDLPPITEGSYIFKVSLGKQVYRKLVVPATATLDDLAFAILDAFEFDDTEHLYDFSYKNFYGITETIAHPEVDNDHELCTEEATVGHLPLQVNMVFVFHFDFGDDWRFDIQVEKMASPSDIEVSDIQIIEKQGKPPAQYDDYEEFDEYADGDEE